MKVLNKLMNGSVGRHDYYKYHFTEKSFIEKVRKNIFRILTEYGKVATMSSKSISNMKNIHISVSINNDDVDVLISWGKNDSERQYFTKKIKDIINKNDKDVSISELVSWIQGKKKFFKANPNMLSSRATFYKSKYIKSDVDYANKLKEKILNRKSGGGDRSVFRGISNKSNAGNPIKPIYTKKQTSFYKKIQEEVDRLIEIRINEISEASVNRFCSKHKGNYRYRVIIDDKVVLFLKKPEYVMVEEELEQIIDKYSYGTFTGNANSRPESLKNKKLSSLSSSIQNLKISSLSSISNKSVVLAKLRRIK